MHLYYYRYFLLSSDISEKSLTTYNEYLPSHVKALGSLKKLEDAEIKNLFNAVKDRYFGGKLIDKEKLYGLSNFMTDTFFGIPAMLTLEDRVKRLTAPNYFCKFSYIGNEKTSTDLLVTRHISGEAVFLFFFNLLLSHSYRGMLFLIKSKICNFYIKILKNFKSLGASHVDDIAYLLYLPRCKTENPNPPAVGTKDRITLERMTRMWTNFAKTG